METNVTETIFVADGLTRRPEEYAVDVRALRERKLREVSAYLYSGWEYDGWGSAPRETHAGVTGFYFVRRNATSGPGFGARPLLDRLASGLHWGVEVTSERNTP